MEVAKTSLIREDSPASLREVQEIREEKYFTPVTPGTGHFFEINCLFVPAFSGIGYVLAGLTRRTSIIYWNPQISYISWSTHICRVKMNKRIAGEKCEVESFENEPIRLFWSNFRWMDLANLGNGIHGMVCWYLFWKHQKSDVIWKITTCGEWNKNEHH